MTGKAPIDGWTAVHLGTGFVFGHLGVRPLTSALLAAGYEVLEQYIESTPRGREAFGSAGPESAVNVFVDLAAFALGYAAGRGG